MIFIFLQLILRTLDDTVNNHYIDVILVENEYPYSIPYR